jgi:HD-like signal output (HDOD) protein/CheY-like chemotaxis protein
MLKQHTLGRLAARRLNPYRPRIRDLRPQRLLYEFPHQPISVLGLANHASRKMKRILFVDDEPHLLDALQRMLRAQRKEWQMSFAHGAAEALAVLQSAPFDVIVTDMRMPETDGAQLLEYVRERHPSVIRIVLSGHIELEAALRAVPVAHQFLSKPCDPEKLRTAIQRACECRAKLNDEELRAVIGAIGILPSLPATCASLLAALQDPQLEMTRVTKIIEQDVGITGKVLQLVNSAFFGLRSEVTSVRAAVNCLGVEILQHLILSVEIFRSFQPPPAYASWLADFEAHSRLAAAIAARLPVPPSLASTAVVGSLIHDAGKLVLATRLPEQFDSALQTASKERVPLHRAEQRLTGTTHAQVGAYLFELWGLPEAIVDAVRGHHQPAAAPVSGRELNVLAATHVADALAHELKANVTAEASLEDPLLDMDYIGALGMSDQLPQWRSRAREAIGIA